SPSCAALAHGRHPREGGDLVEHGGDSRMRGNDDRSERIASTEHALAGASTGPPADQRMQPAGRPLAYGGAAARTVGGPRYGECQMAVLASQVLTRGAEFAENRRAMQAALDEVAAAVATSRAGGGQRARARHVARGKLLPRDRVEELLDPGAP